MFFLSALVISLSLILGTPAQATTQAPTEAAQAPTQAPVQDDTAFDDCPTGDRAACVHPLEVEAWTAIDQAGITAPASPEQYMLSYHGSWTPTAASQPLPLGWFVMESNTHKGLMHHFSWDLITKA